VRLVGKLVRLFVLLLVLGLGLYFGGPLLLAAAGRYLVTSPPLAKADLAVVLSGETFLRVPEAARLYHDALVPAILLSSGRRPPGLDELRRIGLRYPDEEEIALAILDGLRVPRSAVHLLPERSDGTRDEMRAVARFLGTHRARRLLVVTSKSHSTRSQKLFRAGLPPEVEVAVHAVASDPFDPDRWWKTGSHRRQVVYEYLRLLDYWRLKLWQALTGGDWMPTAPVRIAARAA
jgi:uncharacterized SAM-binding protein YcdF (DUF218 family)